MQRINCGELPLTSKKQRTGYGRWRGGVGSALQKYLSELQMHAAAFTYMRRGGEITTAPPTAQVDQANLHTHWVDDQRAIL